MAKYEEQIPLEWKAGGLSYSTGLTLAKAQKMILAGKAEARRLGLSMVIAIVDAGGHLLAFARSLSENLWTP